ncbi:MAG: hypothetical protein QNM02_08870 [Acidimicrobiia bacterium]|nr:hypothetical protein [Acidimicrobiia bacterium]
MTTETAAETAAENGAELAPAVRRSPFRWRRPDWGLLIASLVIAGGVALIVWGFVTANTGDDGIDRPAPIEDVSPVENAVQVLQQEQIRVDLEFGYEAILVVDGEELPTTALTAIESEPGAQVVLPPTAIFDAANGVIAFIPAEGALVESFSEGRHDAQVIYWKSEDGRETARRYQWSFTVV